MHKCGRAGEGGEEKETRWLPASKYLLPISAFSGLKPKPKPKRNMGSMSCQGTDVKRIHTHATTANSCTSHATDGHTKGESRSGLSMPSYVLYHNTTLQSSILMASCTIRSAPATVPTSSPAKRMGWIRWLWLLSLLLLLLCFTTARMRET